MNWTKIRAAWSPKLNDTAQMKYKHLPEYNACASNKGLTNIRLTDSNAYFVERFVNNSLAPVAELSKLQGRTDAQQCSTVGGV